MRRIKTALATVARRLPSFADAVFWSGAAVLSYGIYIVFGLGVSCLVMGGLLVALSTYGRFGN